MWRHLGYEDESEAKEDLDKLCTSQENRRKRLRSKEKEGLLVREAI
jgi:hypothetical protein